MAKFAIVRADGAVDTAEGMSVQDISDRYGWPGNGTIEPFEDSSHGGRVRHAFDSPADQLAEWQKVAEAEGQAAASAPASDVTPAAGPSAADVAVKVLVATHTREELDDIAAAQGIEGTFNTKSDVAAAIVAAQEE